MCKEPDNLSSALVKHYSSLPELEIDEQLLVRKVHLLCNRGRIKLGQGDNSLGGKVAGMMSKLGLTEIGIRLNIIPINEAGKAKLRASRKSGGKMPGSR